jgi:hypothetical protein
VEGNSPEEPCTALHSRGYVEFTRSKKTTLTHSPFPLRSEGRRAYSPPKKVVRQMHDMICFSSVTLRLGNPQLPVPRVVQTQSSRAEEPESLEMRYLSHGMLYARAPSMSMSGPQEIRLTKKHSERSVAYQTLSATRSAPKSLIVVKCDGNVET